LYDEPHKSPPRTCRGEDQDRAHPRSNPDRREALIRIAAELARHGHGPRKPLAQAQLRLLLHPDSTHSDFKKAAEEQHGDGFGSFLAGLAKGILGPVIGIGKAIFGHPAAREAAKTVAGSLVKSAVDAAKAKAAKA
jgi:hypothetical protein